jgi:hypothetical protein
MFRLVFRFEVVVVAASVAVGGCSFVIVDPAPPRYLWTLDDARGGHQHCTAFPLSSIVDGVVAVGIGTATVFAVESTPHNHDGLPPQMIGLLAVPFALAAIYGLDATSTCRSYLAGPLHLPADGGGR